LRGEILASDIPPVSEGIIFQFFFLEFWFYIMKTGMLPRPVGRMEPFQLLREDVSHVLMELEVLQL
jgi:hypothetical protein